MLGTCCSVILSPYLSHEVVYHQSTILVFMKGWEIPSYFFHTALPRNPGMFELQAPLTDLWSHPNLCPTGSQYLAFCSLIQTVMIIVNSTSLSEICVGLHCWNASLRVLHVIYFINCTTTSQKFELLWILILWREIAKGLQKLNYIGSTPSFLATRSVPPYTTRKSSWYILSVSNTKPFNNTMYTIRLTGLVISLGMINWGLEF